MVFVFFLAFKQVFSQIIFWNYIKKPIFEPLIKIRYNVFIITSKERHF